MSILLETENIDYNKISLGIPNQLYNNSFFTRILLDENPIIIQSGSCICSYGIKKVKNKYLCDLIFIENNTIIKFFESLENKVKSLLQYNKDDWFENDVSEEDVDEAFSSSIHFHKNGIKLKTFIQQNTLNDTISLNCYDSNHNLISNDLLLPNTELIPIFEIVGLRITDKTINIEIKLIQVLILDSLNTSQTYTFHNDKITRAISNITSNKDLQEEPNQDDAESHEEEPNQDDAESHEEEPNQDDAESHEEEPNNSNGNTKEDNKINDVSLNVESNHLDVFPFKLKTHREIYEEIWNLYKVEAYNQRRLNLQQFLQTKNLHNNFSNNKI